MYGSKSTTKNNKPTDTTGSTGRNSGGSGGFILPQTGVKSIPICLRGHRNCTTH